MDVEPRTPRSTAVKVGLIVLGIVFLLPGVCGTLFLGGSLMEWLSSGFRFRSGDLNLAPGIVLIGGSSVIGSIVLLTILFSSSRWSQAPKFYLPLAIFAALTILLGAMMMRGSIAGDNSEELITFYLTSIAGILIGFLPPFLLWRESRARNKDGA